MGKGIRKKKKAKLDSLIETCEEHCISILVSLAKYCRGIQLDRFIYKFKENNQEKCERLLEYMNYYYKKFEKNYKEKIEDDEIIIEQEQDEESKYLEKINSGLFNIQNVSLIIYFLQSLNDDHIKEKLRNLMILNNVDSNEIKETVKDMYFHIGEEIEKTDSPSTKIFIENLLKNID